MAVARFFILFALTSFSTIGSLSAQSSFDITLDPTSFAGNTAAQAAFERAANQWEAFITDPILVTVNADFTSLGTGQLAVASPVSLDSGFDSIRNQIVSDSLDEADDTITQSLPTAMQLSVNLPASFTLSGDLRSTKANLKALGVGDLDANFGTSDGLISFGSGISYDFDNSDGVTPGSFDFESVAAHEIGHILGFTSALDVVDAFLDAGTPGAISLTPFDLYRFEDGSINDPTTALEFTTAVRSLAPGSNDIFDQILAGPGLTELPLSTGLSGGDGEQASHFEDGLDLGALDPTLSQGLIVPVDINDARVLDLVGYDITITTVPEPNSVALIILLAGPAMLRRRRA